MPHRLFIAIDLPLDVKGRLARLVRDAPDGVKPVRAEQIHLTLHFLGEVADESLERLFPALGSVQGAGFTVDLAGGGCFPSPRRPTVLWVGVRPNEPLRELHDAVADGLHGCGLPTETRPFMPHVTVARVSRRLPRGWLEAFLHAAAGFAVEAVPVTAFTLFSSQRGESGSLHVPLRHYPLASPT